MSSHAPQEGIIEHHVNFLASESLSKNRLASIVANRAILLTDEDMIRTLVDDCLDNLSSQCNGLPDVDCNSRFDRYLQDCFHKLIHSVSDGSNLCTDGSSFCTDRLAKFMKPHNLACDPFDFECLLRLLSELRESFETLSSSERTFIRPNTGANSTDSSSLVIVQDATFLIIWATITSARSVLTKSLCDKFDIKLFLATLRLELDKNIHFRSRFRVSILIDYVAHLEKLMLTYVTVNDPSLAMVNTSNSNPCRLDSWFSETRQRIARVSLMVGNPYESWIATDIRLCSRAIESTSSAQDIQAWNEALLLNIKARKLMGDSNHLEDVKLMSKLYGFPITNKALNLMISNLRGSYEQCERDYLAIKKPDQPCLLEYIKCCLELGYLDGLGALVQEINCQRTKSVLETYLTSKNSNVGCKSKFFEVNELLHTWSESNHQGESTGEVHLNEFIDIVIPTFFNLVQRSPDVDRTELLTITKGIISHEFIVKSLFMPSKADPQFSCYPLILKSLDGSEVLSGKLVHSRSHDLTWNHRIYRSLEDLDVIQSSCRTDPAIDFVQLRAAKYHQRCQNFNKAQNMLDNLIHQTDSNQIMILSQIVVAKKFLQSSIEEYIKHLYISASSIPFLDLDYPTKNDLALKLLRSILKVHTDSYTTKDFPLNKVLTTLFDFLSGEKASKSSEDIPPIMSPCQWSQFLDRATLESSLKTRVKLMEILSSQSSNESNDSPILELALREDLRLLDELSKVEIANLDYKSLQCATRILDIVTCHSKYLGPIFNELVTPEFAERTIDAWTMVKAGVIGVMTADGPLEDDIFEALSKIMRVMCRRYPFCLLYQTIVDKLDIEYELRLLKEKDPENNQDAILMQKPLDNFIPNENDNKEAVRIEGERRLALWSSCLDEMLKLGGKWPQIIAETQEFVGQIRRISFLPGEFLSYECDRIRRRLCDFIDKFRAVHDQKSGLIPKKIDSERVEEILKKVCQQSLRPVKILNGFINRACKGEATKYDHWFCQSFHVELPHLEYLLGLLEHKRKPLNYNDCFNLVYCINTLLLIFKKSLTSYNDSNRQKLYMELISPHLSRLQPSLIPMPGMPHDVSRRIGNSDSRYVQINKILQTVTLIHSKTKPKKVQFQGSDGRTRPFLLKAHEDLRLNKLFMDVFSGINRMLGAAKTTRSRHRIRGYSVIPMSSGSGLIEWVDGIISLGHHYSNWLTSDPGMKARAKLIGKYCPELCAGTVDHFKCEPPVKWHISEPYHTLLWAHTIKTNHPLTINKPCVQNDLEYRRTFDPKIYQSVVAELIDFAPNDIISNQLWFRATNAHSYWLKVQEFTRSCATMSIVGYVLGLGDRHSDNILIDYNSGDVTHIDYGISFELGKCAPVPEKVPFRLTQNIIRAFGFAGLEGNFTRASGQVLDVLKANKSTLLNLLHPRNLAFMIVEESKQVGNPPELGGLNILATNGLEPTDTLTRRCADSTAPTKPLEKVVTANVEDIQLCSQEDFVDATPRPATLIMDKMNSPPGVLEPVANDNNVLPIYAPKQQPEPTRLSYDIGHNIRVSAKITPSEAIRIHNRIRDKLSGRDEELRNTNYMFAVGQTPTNRLLWKLANENSKGGACKPISHESDGSDLIVLDDLPQSTEDQIDALVIEATCLKNKALMFVGYLAWF